MELTQLDETGAAPMVDVGEKAVTRRTACAQSVITMKPETLRMILDGTAPKGDVFACARIAGIMAAKRTAELIPMCHPICLNKAAVEFELDEEVCEIKATCQTKVSGKTGVEMEALMGVNAALLTIYDMCKAMDRGMEIFAVHLEEKDGGKSGHFVRQEEN